MIFAQVSPMKISKIFLTHYHGDHILGLPGLIQSMNFGGREKPLDIYGPKGIEKIATVVRSLSKENFKFEINYHEISEGTIIETEEYVIKSCRVRHNVESLAYSIEKIKKPKFLREKAIALDIPEGPLYGQLQDGNAVELEDGRIIQPEQVLGNEVKGVNQKVVDNCDISVEIPQYGTKHSLNVSVSAGIVIWELARQFY